MKRVWRWRTTNISDNHNVPPIKPYLLHEGSTILNLQSHFGIVTHNSWELRHFFMVNISKWRILSTSGTKMDRVCGK